ncbi:MAG TPA: vWA domain-containing protein, partial [Polyangiales bacterium]
MREVRWSLTALILVSSACGSTDPIGSSALPDQMTDDSSDDDKTADTKDGGTGGGKDAGRDAGKDAGKDAGSSRKDAGKDTDPNDCGRSAFNTGSVVPDMLIVLDRSGSMKPGLGLPPGASCKDNVLLAIPCAIAGIDCNDPKDAMTVYCGGMGDAVDRWTPSVNAVKSLTSQFDKDVSFGLVTFPSKASNSCGPGDFQVDMALNTSGDIAKVLDNTQPGGNTPTGETLKAALELFESTSASADTVAPARYVLLVTDGQPTCPSGRGGPQDKQYTLDQIDALAKFGVKTFVVGYDAQLDPS